jgi:hypothetical protein
VSLKLGQNADIGQHGRGQDDQIGLGREAKVVSPDIRDTPAQGALDNRLAIDRNEPDRWPSGARRQPNRRANEPETHDGEALEWRDTGRTIPNL